MKMKIILLFVLTVNAVSAQWTRISDSPFHLERIYFYSTEIGYALKGNKLNGNKIYKTQDGGATWNTVFTFPDYLKTVKDIFFTSPDTGFAYIKERSGFLDFVSIYITVDGGVTWKSTLGPFAGSNIDFRVLNRNEWYFLVKTYNNQGRIFHTDDAGNTWTIVETATTVQFNILTGNQIVYKDSSISDHANLLYKSIDGGASWNLLLSDSTEYSTFKDYQFLNNNDGYVLLYQYNASDTRVSKLYKTNDAGKTWSRHDLPKSCTGPQQIHFTSSAIGYIISNTRITNKYRGELYKTIDGGESWNIDLVADTNEYFTIWEFFGNVYILGKDIITNKPTSIQNLHQVIPEIILFPNPTNGLVTMLFKEEGNRIVRIIDVTGSEVRKSKKVSGKHVKIDLLKFSSGIYFIETSNKEGLIGSQKVIIRRR